MESSAKGRIVENSKGSVEMKEFNNVETEKQVDQADLDQEKDWSEKAENFEELQRYVAGDNTTDIMIEELSILKELGNTLELGCGSGTFTFPLAENAESVVALDCSEAMVSAAKKRLNEVRNVQVEQGDCYQTRFKSESFDTIMMANLIHVVSFPEKALEEVHRLLKKGGRLIVLSFTKDGMEEKDLEEMIKRYLKTFGMPAKNATPFLLDSLKDFMEKHDFKIKEAKLVGMKSKAMFVIGEKH